MLDHLPPRRGSFTPDLREKDLYNNAQGVQNHCIMGSKMGSLNKAKASTFHVKKCGGDSSLVTIQKTAFYPKVKQRSIPKQGKKKKREGIIHVSGYTKKCSVSL
eukprot:TRINITY_DN341_c0_g2_i2.p1 TRINITY_DN341_c0_g2~~TRINITY_DN341_c0_g2_i2.p1  ORF type:complete len:104 (-),score=21.56 TRINITY_DN341_c0_g2_i2:197-508(-)